MLSTNPYDQLKPYWHKFCLVRRELATERADGHRAWANGGMREALREWGEAVDAICGPTTTVEWPESEERPRRDRFFTEEFVEGPCVVAGVMMFVDEVERLAWD